MMAGQHHFFLLLVTGIALSTIGENYYCTYMIVHILCARVRVACTCLVHI